MHFKLLLSVALVASTAAASPYDWRSYPNAGRAVQYDLSPEWLLIDRGAIEVTALESVLGKALPEAVLARLQPLLSDRMAIRVVGTDVEGLHRLGDALRRAGLVGAAWPVGQREQGLGFFDDRLTVAGSPDPAVLKAHGVQLVGAAFGDYHAAVAEDGDAVGAAWRLQGLPGLRFAEPDLIRDAVPLALPDDPRINEQWHLENSEGGTGDIDASAAWDLTTGDPAVTVAIIDTGFDMDHPDLAVNIVGGFDALANDDDPEAGCSESPDGAGPAGSCPADRPYRESHGTAVAGVVAARGNNAVLGAGVCPDCTLFPIRFIGAGGFRTLSGAITFQRAADAGVSVVNNSWGPSLTRFFPLADAEREVFDNVTLRAREGKGVVLVFAAGNDFFTPATANPYAAHPGVITVSASTRIDDFACYSNYGSNIAVAGPSQGCFDGEGGIGTTDFVGGEGYSNSDFTRSFGGTSAASPVVAGVAALILSANPDLTAQQVRLVLQRTAEKIRADKNPWRQQLGVDLAQEFAYDERGFSQGFGYGRINAARAVELARNLPDAVAGVCDEACPRCIADRCAPPCDDDADCPGAARCLEVEGARACVIPTPPPNAVGQPCSLDCETCVQTVDSNFDAAQVCSVGCETDAECPFGFDCRTLRANARACVPGNQECGSPWGSVRCQGDVRVIGDGVEYCSCECIPRTQGACPDGFECVQTVFCERDRGGIACRRAASANEANYYPTCFPDPDYRQSCAAHRECAGGLFCIDGKCAADRYRAGCDICAPCSVDDDCARDEVCIDTPRGQKCLKPCEFGGDEGQCPGDSVCTDVPGPAGDHCVNPDYSRKGVCPSAYRCLVEDRCYLADDCPPGVECVDNTCQVPGAPDQGVTDGGAGDAASTADASATEDGAQPDGGADAASPDAAEDADRPAPSDDGCQSAPGGAFSPLWLLLALPLRRRRVA